MPKTSGHSRRTLQGVFKKTATDAAEAALTDEATDAPEHARSFHDFLDLPAFEAFRMASGAEFTTHPDVFPFDK